MVVTIVRSERFLTASSPVSSLQVLRALAALAIVAYHIDGGLNVYMPMPSAFHLFAWGKEGVPLFFVLSGFVVSLASQLRPRGAREFLYGRLARLYPVYLFTAVLFISLLLLLPPSVFRSPLPVNLAGALKTLCFEYGQPTGYVYVGWVLFYEACFYLIFSPMVSRFHWIATRPWFSALLSTLLAATAISHSSLISYFLCGIAAFLLCVNPGRLAMLNPWRLLLLSAVLANGMASPVALAAFGIVAGLFLLEVQTSIFDWPWPGFLRQGFKGLFVLGDASYSIYLAQVLTLSASLKFSRLLVSAVSPGPAGHSTYLLYWCVALVVGVSTTVVAGVLMRNWIEIPSYRFLMRFAPRRAASGGRP